MLVELGATHAFLAVVSSGAHPAKSVLWSVSGPSCPLLCGSVNTSGNYTAPQILPASPNVTLTARSVAVSSTVTFIATLKPVRIKSEHSFLLELVWERVQRIFVWGFGPAQFDGNYAIERLPTGRSYQVYAEPLNGAVDPSEISNATASLCRNSTSDPG